MVGRVVAVLVVSGALLWRMSASQEGDGAERVRRARAASNEAIQQHDAERVASFWTEDYTLLSSTNLQISGRDANRSNFADHFRDRPDVVYVRTPRDIGFYAPWGMAYELGDWKGSWTEKGGTVAIGGTYYAKWQRVGERWLIRAEVFVPTHCEGTGYCDPRP